MPRYPVPIAKVTPLGWFALGLPVAFLLNFFTSPGFAGALGLSFGAALMAFSLRRGGGHVPLWLALPGPAVFAFLAGSFGHGFLRHAEIKTPARIAEGLGEALLMVFANGELPLEGAQRLNPWPGIGAVWLGLSILAGIVLWATQRSVPGGQGR